MKLWKSRRVHMIFPRLAPEYLTDNDRPVLQFMEEKYAQAITLNQEWWGQADIDLRYYSGDQSLYSNIFGNMPVQQRKDFTFNRIRPQVNMVSGFQAKNRKSTIVVPVENADQETADQFSGILQWADRQEGILESISEAFHSALITGMSLLHVYMDYAQDPVNGDIKVDVKPYNTFMIDPYFKKRDLSDCDFIWSRSFINRSMALAIFPEQQDVIMSLSTRDSKDGKFNFMPETYQYSYTNQLIYDEFYYRDFRKQQLLVDTQTGEVQEWTGKDDDTLDLFLQTYPQIDITETIVPTVRVALVLQGKVMYDGPQPSGIDTYSHIPVIGYYQPDLPYYPDRLQGMVRGMRDAQYLYNRRQVLNLKLLESQITSGWKYKENALVNPEHVHMTGDVGGLALKNNAQMTDVEQILPPQVPPTTMQLTQELGNELSKISGVNEELLGAAVDEKAGILSMLRQGAGLTTLQGLFDSLDYAQKLLGKRMIAMIQANFTPGKVKRILNEEPQPQFYNKAFGKYDAAIEEGINTSTQKQMQFAQLLQLREMGVPIPDSVIIESASIQNKSDVIEAMEQEKQAAMEQQQMAQQLQAQDIEARVNLANARAEADRGLGYERLSRIKENQALAVERSAQAKHDSMKAILDLVRAIKEIDGVDLANIEKVLMLENTVRADTQNVVRGDTTLPGKQVVST